MYNKIDKIYETLETFKEIHIKCAKWKDPDYREILSPKDKPNEEYNLTFLEAKKLILKKFPNHHREKMQKERSFIIYSKELFIFDSYEIVRHGNYLDLKRYLDILERNRNYFGYLGELKNIEELKNFPHLTLFKLDDLNGFCNNIISDYMDTIDIKQVNLGYDSSSYAYEGEEKTFEEIDDLYQMKNYRGVIDGCDTIFGLFVKDFFESQPNAEKFFFTDGEKDKKMKKAFEMLASRCKLSLLKDNIDTIVKQFNIVRNKLKPKAPYEKDLEFWEGFNKLPEPVKKLYTRISIDLTKVIHNALVILKKEKI